MGSRNTRKYLFGYDVGVIPYIGIQVNSGEALRETPAFVDLQVNGFAGIDFNNPRTLPSDYHKAVEAMWATGVTRLLPTVITGDQETMCQCLRIAAAAAEIAGIGPSIVGIHVEGPWISPLEGPRGAHPKQHVRAPNRDDFE